MSAAVLVLDRHAAFTAPACAHSVGVLRAGAAVQLAKWGVREEVVATAVLIADELLTNALAYGEVDVLVLRVSATPERVTVEVDDNVLYPPFPTRQDLTDPDESGRGVHLVAMLAARWGATFEAKAKTVWAEIGAEP